MLDTILTKVWSSHDIHSTSGAFLSVFDSAWQPIASHWTIQSTKQLSDLIPILYNALVWSAAVWSVVVDVVTNVVEHTDKTIFSSLDMSISGICVVGDNSSGVLLPWTIGIGSSKDALVALKKKYNITGKIHLYSFSTDRISVT